MADINIADASITAPSDWQYVSEGGATIVFSYKGPEHPVFTGTVLRLRKTGLDHIPPSDGSLERDVVVDFEEPDDPTISFQHRVTSKLIPPTFLPRLEAVRVDRSWLENLRSSSDKDRPLERKKKDTIDTSHRKAVLATDLVGGEGWSVEIKVRLNLEIYSVLLNLTDSLVTHSLNGGFCRTPHIYLRKRKMRRVGDAATACIISTDQRRVKAFLMNTALSIFFPETKSAYLSHFEIYGKGGRRVVVLSTICEFLCMANSSTRIMQ